MSATQILDAKFLTILWDEKTLLIGIDWKETTAAMTDEEFSYPSVHRPRTSIGMVEGMRTKAIRQTVTFKDAPMEVNGMIMDSRKHQSLSGEKAARDKFAA
jgi:hypothetical protein